jgi:concanavalin A-like lectin/glucanase superfamily protein/putative zinc finger protein
MTEECPKIQDQITEWINGVLPAERVRAVEDHLLTCPDCQGYREALEHDGQLLSDYVQSVDEIVARLEDRVLEKLNVETEQPKPSIWSTIMSNRITQFAAAAMIAIVGIAGLYYFLFNSPSPDDPGVAWGNVFKKVANVTNYVHRVKMTVTGVAEEPRVVEFVIYRSTEFGIRRDSYLKGELYTQLYAGTDSHRGCEVIPSQKKYVQAVWTDEQLQEIREKNDPRKFAEEFSKFTYKEIGRKTVNGIECEGIEITDPGFGKMVFEKGTGRFWVDVEKELPVLIEMEGTAADGKMQISLTIDEFQWNAPLIAADFEPNIPDDYTLMAKVDLSDTEQTLIKGLRGFAELSGGLYPSSLDLMTASTEIQVGFIVQRRLQGIDMEQEPTRLEMEKILAIQGSCMFINKLRGDEKEPAYYGKFVTKENPEAVLVRWKLEDDQYRVVFSDLQVGTVTKEQLNALETAPLNTNVQAVKPLPANDTIGTALEGIKLSWSSGKSSVENKVYFGTDLTNLALLETVKNTECANTCCATANPTADVPTLQRGVTYYWRVDSIGADGTVTPGEVWSFHTGSLVGHWKLEAQRSGVAGDSSGNDLSGMLQGDPAWVSGRIGQGVELDGDGDYVDLGSKPEFNLVHQISVACWIKVNAFDKEWQALVTKGDLSWRLSRGLENNLHFGCTGMWPEWVHGKKNVNDGQWHHVAGTFDGNKLSLYVDGQLDVSAAIMGGPRKIHITDEPVLIGANSQQEGRNWNGLVDEVRIYNYALSVEEIQALYTGEK